MYNYATERPKLFTEEGQVMLLKVRDNVQRLLKEAGAFTSEKAWQGVTGDGWQMLACLDRLEELGEIERQGGGSWAQYQVYSLPRSQRRA